VQLRTLQRSGNALASAETQLAILQDPTRLPGPTFAARLVKEGIDVLRRSRLDTLQINVGRVCNQTCAHCHVDAGPDRRESLSAQVAEQVISFLARSQVSTLDITGGAPEMNPNFRMLVQQASGLGKQIIDRCNLTILLANGFTDLPEFLATHQVRIVASLPCYLEQNCDAQRGDGVFEKSIEALLRLNRLGYGQTNSGLTIDLVYNPTGYGLPPNQLTLEHAYREQLFSKYNITFNNLFTITNMPVSRFLDSLLKAGKFEQYMEKLISSFNPQTIEQLMCLGLVSIDWQGYLYDCDFNQMLDLPILHSNNRKLHIGELTDQEIVNRSIRIANHCYGCTAGCGSSCSGSLL
jgi:radical SAM/Cys-rich protein